MSDHSVGPVFSKCKVSEQLIQAILLRHPEAKVIDYDSYLRVLVPELCTLRRKDVEELTGQVFTLPQDLEPLMPSFKGTLEMNEDEVAWSFAGGAA